MTGRQIFSRNSKRPWDEIRILRDVAPDVHNRDIGTRAQHGVQLIGGNARHVDALHKAAPLNALPRDPCHEYTDGENNEARSHSHGIADGEFKLIAEDISGDNV